MYFIDHEHESNFQTVLMKWPNAKKNTEYLAPCYILAIPMIFEKVGNRLFEFQNPVDWIWRWEWKYTLSKLTDKELSEEEDFEIPYDLTSSMVQLGKFSLNMWNGYQHFNLMNCIGSLDQENYDALIQAIDIRKGRLSV